MTKFTLTRDEGKKKQDNNTYRVNGENLMKNNSNYENT